MKAYLRSVRIAPKKANLIAKMVRGMPVSEALTALTRTNKKAARLVEDLIKSAVANATHNEKQDAAQLLVKTIVVNQGTAYQRGVPKARGSVRPIRKFLSHISVTLGLQETAEQAEKPAATKKTPSRKPKNTVETTSSSHS